MQTEKEWYEQELKRQSELDKFVSDNQLGTGDDDGAENDDSQEREDNDSDASGSTDRREPDNG